MVEIFTASSCRSCNRAIEWLQTHHIPYVEQNLEIALNDKEQVEKILENAENGFDSIISLHSDAYKKLKINFDDLKISEVMEIMAKNPTIVKRPIIIDLEHKNMEVGYNKDSIEIFALAATHDYKTCPLSIKECRKQTRIKLFKKHFNIEEILNNDNKE